AARLMKEDVVGRSGAHTPRTPVTGGIGQLPDQPSRALRRGNSRVKRQQARPTLARPHLSVRADKPEDLVEFRCASLLPAQAHVVARLVLVSPQDPFDSLAQQGCFF